MTRKIVFTDIKAAPKGEIVVSEDGKSLKGSTEALQKIADQFIENDGGTVEDFVHRFTHWSNGYSWSHYVEDGEE